MCDARQFFQYGLWVGAYKAERRGCLEWCFGAVRMTHDESGAGYGVETESLEGHEHLMNIWCQRRAVLVCARFG